MKKINVPQTKSFADEVRRCSLNPLALEPDVVNRILAEIDQLALRMDYDSRDPMEQVMIEQVLTAHTQNLVAMYQLENMPINTCNTRQHKHLTERVRSTHHRLCRSMSMLTALRIVGPRLNLNGLMPGRLVGKPTKAKVWTKKDIPPGHTHYIWEVGPDDSHWLEYKDPHERREAVQRNQDLISWRDFRAKCPEAFVDQPPHKFISVRYVGKPYPIDIDADRVSTVGTSAATLVARDQSSVE